jgi:hypothetical protein
MFLELLIFFLLFLIASKCTIRLLHTLAQQRKSFCSYVLAADLMEITLTGAIFTTLSIWITQAQTQTYLIITSLSSGFVSRVLLELKKRPEWDSNPRTRRNGS